MAELRTTEINAGTGFSRIFVGESLDNLARHCRKGTFLVTDQNVHRLYGGRFPDFPVKVLPAGEKNKTLALVEQIYAFLMEQGADRDCLVVGVGGGVVCDMAGFAASTYLRGVSCGLCPTTLLAQVDAGVGGKTGVNFSGYKNMVGTFSQPEFVLCDPEVLSTLAPEDLACGFAEMVKHGAITDAAYFARMEDLCQQALELDPEAVSELVHGSVRIKAGVVSRDEREGGLRRILNFGHTFGHALEKGGRLPHGFAVSMGMAAAARLSVARGLLRPQDAERLIALLRRYRLPVEISGYDPSELADALFRDKKRAGDAVRFVLLKEIGKAEVVPISLAELGRVAEKLY
ncbi:MAG: 3-dehydroquinate synthase [Thermodesulfobacteriota bacterium]